MPAETVTGVNDFVLEKILAYPNAAWWSAVYP